MVKGIGYSCQIKLQEKYDVMEGTHAKEWTEMHVQKCQEYKQNNRAMKLYLEKGSDFKATYQGKNSSKETKSDKTTTKVDVVR